MSQIYDIYGGPMQEWVQQMNFYVFELGLYSLVTLNQLECDSCQKKHKRFQHISSSVYFSNSMNSVYIEILYIYVVIYHGVGYHEVYMFTDTSVSIPRLAHLAYGEWIGMYHIIIGGLLCNN